MDGKKDKDGDENQKEKVEETKSEGAEGTQTSKDEENFMEKLGKYFTGAMQIDKDVEKVLDEVSFEAVARFLKSDKCKNVITMAGAGISTSAGIPDFRSPGSGLYDNLQKYNLPTPMAVFEINFFLENPEPFFQLSKQLWPGHFKPTPCHYFIKQLYDKGKLLRHYTQNIDTLEHHTGLDKEKIVEAHGTFRTSHCLECRKEYTQEWIKELIFADKVPRCTEEKCDGIVKPDIVFFGEGLPKRFFSCVQEVCFYTQGQKKRYHIKYMIGQATSDSYGSIWDFDKCDLLIILGTSLTVQPFAGLLHRVPDKTPRLYINLDKGNTDMDPFMAMLMGGSGLNFDGENNYRDVFKQSTCDDGCFALADTVGWGEELKATVKKEHARLDAEIAKEKQTKTTSKV